jgi:hypothetical protein
LSGTGKSVVPAAIPRKQFAVAAHRLIRNSIDFVGSNGCHREATAEDNFGFMAPLAPHVTLLWRVLKLQEFQYDIGFGR